MERRKERLTGFRQRRNEHILRLIEGLKKRDGIELVDVGGKESFWTSIPRSYLVERNVRITLVNIKQQSVSDTELFTSISASGTNLSFVADRYFDVAVSNSVIEHVGNKQNMTKFANEIRRIANAYYVQTPNFWFPFEPHFKFPVFHWLPMMVRLWLISRFNIGSYRKAQNNNDALRKVNDAKLLTHRQLKRIFPDASIFRERFFMLTKSFMAIREPTRRLSD